MLAKANRLHVKGDNVFYKQYFQDFAFERLSALRADTLKTERRLYVVQTPTLPMERCLLMTTDPGDLVLDPTCGSGTTAYVAEQWGWGWITVDTTRVPLALARQRLLTATFSYYAIARWESGRERRV